MRNGDHQLSLYSILLLLLGFFHSATQLLSFYSFYFSYSYFWFFHSAAQFHSFYYSSDSCDNAQPMRNGDHQPSRYEAQIDIINMIIGIKTQVGTELICKK